MKVLVTGVKGQLGFDIVNECRSRQIEVIGVDIEDLDITDGPEVKKFIMDGNFTAIIHCAAWTAVDKAEEEPEACYKVNVDGTNNIAKVCEKLNIPMMYFSTDYVFNGEGTKPWLEYDHREPLNIYGKAKYEGELIVEKLPKHFIVRISWVFGINGNNFIKTMLRLGEERDTLTVVDDQFGSPTYTFDLAKLAVDMIQTNQYGVYHATNEGVCSWYEFAVEIFKAANLNVKVIPVDSSAFAVKAKRPRNSRLAKIELLKHGFYTLPTWQNATARYCELLKRKSD